MRRSFQMPEEDETYLAACDRRWEAITEAGVRWLILFGFPVPDAYNHQSVSAALRIPPSYPDDQIDMVYFFPPLALRSGRAIAALSSFQLDGKVYQQWSRHRTVNNPWRSGLDNVGTHLLQVNNWLQRELR